MKRKLGLLALLVLFLAGMCGAASAAKTLYSFAHFSREPYSVGPVTFTVHVFANGDPSKGYTPPIVYYPVQEDGYVYFEADEKGHGEVLSAKEGYREFTVHLESPGYYEISGRSFIVFDPDSESDMAIVQELEDAVARCEASTEWETAKNLNAWVSKKLNYSTLRGANVSEEEAVPFYCFEYNTLKHGHSGANGFSELYSMVLSAAGIENMLVGGSTTVNNGPNHWALCRLDGDWRFTDAFMSKTKGDKYFGLSLSEMAKDHALSDGAAQFYYDYIGVTRYDLETRDFDAAYAPKKSTLPKALQSLPASLAGYRMPESVKSFVSVKSIEEGSDHRVTLNVSPSAYLVSYCYNATLGIQKGFRNMTDGKESKMWTDVAMSESMFAEFEAASYRLEYLADPPVGKESTHQFMTIYNGEVADSRYEYFVPFKKDEYPGYGTDSTHIYVYNDQMRPLSAGWKMVKSGEEITAMVHFDENQSVSGYSVLYKDPKSGLDVEWDCLSDGQVVGFSQEDNELYFKLDDVTALREKPYMGSLDNRIKRQYPDLESSLPEDARCYRLRLSANSSLFGDQLIVSEDPLFVWKDGSLSLNENAVTVKGEPIDFSAYGLDLSPCSLIEFQ